MTMSKNESIEKDDNDKDKQWYDLFIFQKTEKNWVLNINTTCNCSDHLFSISCGYSLDLSFLWYFHKLWCICDLIGIYYLMESYPCYLWIEIFDKLRIGCWVWPKFCWANFIGKLSSLKETLCFRRKLIHVSC